jgi:hypothetical protein
MFQLKDRAAKSCKGGRECVPLMIVYQSKIQREYMKEIDQYDCVYHLDSTHNMNRYGFPLTTLMRKDKSGCGIPVAHIVSSTEREQDIAKFLSIVNVTNDSFQPGAIVVDKSFAEINAVRKIFPKCELVLCYFHVTQAIEKWMNGRSVMYTGTIKNRIHGYIRKMHYANSCDERDKIVALFDSFLNEHALFDFKTYFATNWMNELVYEMWCTCCRRKMPTIFSKDTNNVLESFHRRLKHDDGLGGSRYVRRLDDLLHLLHQVSFVLKVRFQETVICCVRSNHRLRCVYSNSIDEAFDIPADSIVLESSAVVNSFNYNVYTVKSSAIKKLVLEDALDQNGFILQDRYIVIIPPDLKVAAPACTCMSSPSIYCKHIFACLLLEKKTFNRVPLFKNGCQLLVSDHILSLVSTETAKTVILNQTWRPNPEIELVMTIGRCDLQEDAQCQMELVEEDQEQGASVSDKQLDVESYQLHDPEALSDEALDAVKNGVYEIQRILNQITAQFGKDARKKLDKLLGFAHIAQRDSKKRTLFTNGNTQPAKKLVARLKPGRKSLKTRHNQEGMGDEQAK